MSSVIPPLQALVYRDKGVCLQSADALVLQLRGLLSSAITVKQVDGKYLSTQYWEDFTVVLAMGGGTCTLWEENLGGQGMQKIRDYVLNRGKFIGLCAGAYFASATSFFQLKGHSPIEKERILSLFPGKAIGPFIETSNYLAATAAKAVQVSFKINQSKILGYLYYQGGCLFEVDSNDEKTDVVAQYQDRAVGVVSRAGEGSAFLCGLHPEFVWNESEDARIASLSKVLSSEESFRKQVWHEIGKLLFLPTKI